MERKLLIKVYFKTLIPKSVVNWVKERNYEDELLELEKRLSNKLSFSNKNSYFKQCGLVENVKIENNEYVGYCVIEFNIENYF